MDARLADLQAACEAGVALAVERHAAFDHLPERVVISLKAPRKIVMDLAMARAAADQLTENGFPDQSALIMGAIG